MRDKLLLIIVLGVGVSLSVFFAHRYWRFARHLQPIAPKALVAPRPAQADLLGDLIDFSLLELDNLPRAHLDLFSRRFDEISRYEAFFDRLEQAFGARLHHLKVAPRVTLEPGLLHEAEVLGGYGHHLESIGLAVLHLAYYASLTERPALLTRCLVVADDLIRLTLAWPGLDMLSGTWLWRIKYYELHAFHLSARDPAAAMLPTTAALRERFEGAVFLHCATYELILLKEEDAWPPRLFSDELTSRDFLFELRHLYNELQPGRPDAPLLARFPLDASWQIGRYHRGDDVRYVAARIENLAALIGLEIAVLDVIQLRVSLAGGVDDLENRRQAVDNLDLRNPFDGKRYQLDKQGRLIVLPPGSPLFRVLGEEGMLGEPWQRDLAVPTASPDCDGC